MFFRVELNHLQFVVFLVLLVIRTTFQKIALHPGRASNHLDIYTSPYVDTDFCRTIPGLTKYQLELCKQQPDTTMVALEGLNEAVRECQNQFQGHRWNCSTLTTKGKNPYISAILQKGYRETAFSYALASAGVTISVARACSSAALQNCGCDQKIYKLRNTRDLLYKENYRYIPNKRIPDELSKSAGYYPNLGPTYQDPLPNMQYYPSPKENGVTMEQPTSFKWGGCSHNLKYGVRFSKMFLDSRERAGDIHSSTNLHNNQVGRMTVKHNMKINCKCHGLSGSCQIKTCWRSTPDLKLVGQILKEKYKSALLVDQSNLEKKNLRNLNVVNPKQKNKKLLPARTNQGPFPKKKKQKRDMSVDLLYYEKSPDFCDMNPALDVPGTSGRFCNSTLRDGQFSCAALCCGRGYNLIKQTKLERCHCKFVWCCEVKCDICNNTNWVSVCK
ncbi:protein Wnt-2 [Anthonomus grandis grandis]|uniref:protein Wnt-2 n=1 Tax=Anthonomus grandis grandis TaxID=2921223 RepID=UPI0021666235|nr:protein Wnt-2 [Anthonomus grandis grandis]